MIYLNTRGFKFVKFGDDENRYSYYTYDPTYGIWGSGLDIRIYINQCLAKLHLYDTASPHPSIPDRESARFISTSQVCSGSYLDTPLDRNHRSTLIPSPAFTVSLQRRLGLHLSCHSSTCDAAEAADLPHDRVGDSLCNGGEHVRRHGAALRTLSTAVATRSIGSVVLGDKSDEHKTKIFNDGHVVDFAVIGGDPHTGADRCYEVKVPSPCIKLHSLGRGSQKCGGKPASVGNHYAFGNTEEFLRVQILGCAGRGRSFDGPFNHTTGKGWVVEQRGDYYDAIFAKGNSVVTAIIEVFGGFTPRLYSELRRLSRIDAKQPLSRDSTTYGANPRSSKNWLVHHTRLISLSVVVADSHNILNEATCAKFSLLRGVS